MFTDDELKEQRELKPLKPCAYPATHMLNLEFKYTPAIKTDISKTFERVRAAQQGKNETTTQHGTPSRPLRKGE